MKLKKKKDHLKEAVWCNINPPMYSYVEAKLPDKGSGLKIT